jgi:2-polyprenyl-3-methyl-5-hydroxy-6-metoxy-1,4-benzoquinol methylase
MEGANVNGIRRLFQRMPPMLNTPEELTFEEYYGKDRPEVSARIDRSARRVLDVGCGAGMFGASIRRRQGAEVWGLEVNVEAATQAEAQLDRVLIGDALESVRQLPDDYFDCMVFNDVLEHLVDPYAVLGEAKRALTRSGVVVASIPNVRYARVLFELLVQKDWHYQPWGVLDRTHLRFFTRKSIARMFEEQGYEIISLEGINPTQSRYYLPINLMTLGLFSDAKHMQYLCVARAKAGSMKRPASS